MTYPTACIAVMIFRLLVARTESALVDKIWQLLCYKFFDLGDGLFETFFSSAGDMQVEWRCLFLSAKLID